MALIRIKKFKKMSGMKKWGRDKRGYKVFLMIIFLQETKLVSIHK